MHTLLRKTSSTCFTKRGISALSGHSELHHVVLTYRHPQFLGAEEAIRGTVATSQLLQASTQYGCGRTIEATIIAPVQLASADTA